MTSSLTGSSSAAGGRRAGQEAGLGEEQGQGVSLDDDQMMVEILSSSAIGDYQSNIVGDYGSSDSSMETAVEDLRRSFMSHTKTMTPATASVGSTVAQTDLVLSSSSSNVSSAEYTPVEAGGGRMAFGDVGGGSGGELRPDASTSLFWLRRYSDSNVSSDDAQGKSVGALRIETSQTRLLSSSDTMIDSSDLLVVRYPLHADEARSSVVPVADASANAESHPVGTDTKRMTDASVGFMQKRQKLKKYLQTRYQSGLEELAAADAAAAAADAAAAAADVAAASAAGVESAAAASVDSDEVFLDRPVERQVIHFVTILNSYL